MSYEENDYDDEEINCSYCGAKGTCQHLLAVIDRTFLECNEGFAYSRISEFTEIIAEAFIKVLRIRSDSYNKQDWKDCYLDELWSQTVKQCLSNEWLFFEDEEGADLFRNEFANYIDNDALYDLVMGLFQDAGAVMFDAPDADEIPNYSSVAYLLYAKSPEKTFEKALSILEKRLNKRLPKPRSSKANKGKRGNPEKPPVTETIDEQSARNKIEEGWREMNKEALEAELREHQDWQLRILWEKRYRAGDAVQSEDEISWRAENGQRIDLEMEFQLKVSKCMSAYKYVDGTCAMGGAHGAAIRRYEIKKYVESYLRCHGVPPTGQHHIKTKIGSNSCPVTIRVTFQQ